jgi:hypothetical protein
LEISLVSMGTSSTASTLHAPLTIAVQAGDIAGPPVPRFLPGTGLSNTCALANTFGHRHEAAHLHAFSHFNDWVPTFVVTRPPTWASAYGLLGALPDTKSAMLYSLSAITSYGHANLFLEEPTATDGCFGGVKWDASVRADHRLSVRHDSEGLAAGK